MAQTPEEKEEYKQRYLEENREKIQQYHKEYREKRKAAGIKQPRYPRKPKPKPIPEWTNESLEGAPLTTLRATVTPFIKKMIADKSKTIFYTISIDRNLCDEYPRWQTASSLTRRKAITNVLTQQPELVRGIKNVNPSLLFYRRKSDEVRE